MDGYWSQRWRKAGVSLVIHCQLLSELVIVVKPFFHIPFNTEDPGHGARTRQGSVKGVPFASYSITRS